MKNKYLGWSDSNIISDLKKEVADLKEENKDLVAESDQFCRSIFLLEQEITLNHRSKPRMNYYEEQKEE